MHHYYSKQLPVPCSYWKSLFPKFIRTMHPEEAIHTEGYKGCKALDPWGSPIHLPFRENCISW